VTNGETKLNAKQLNENDRTLKGGENIFTNNDFRLTLNDGYFNNKLRQRQEIYHDKVLLSFQGLPQQSPSQFAPFSTFPNSHANKMKEQTSLLTTSAHFPFGCKPLLQPFRLLSSFTFSLSASLPMSVFLHGKCFPHTPEAKTHARFLSAFPKPQTSAFPEAI